MQIQNIDENLSMNISDTSGVSLQVSDVDTSLEMNIDTNDVINLNIINEEGNIGMEVESSGSKVEGTTDHSKLQNLDYEHSGHTGFQPKGDYIEDENYVHTDNNFTDAEKTKLKSLNNYDDTLIKKEVSSNTSQINTLKTSVENKAEKTEIPDVSKFITNTVDNLVNYYKKNETFNKNEIEQFSSEIMEQLDDKASKKEIPSLNGYATEEWVRDQDYMPIPDFREFIEFFYYDKTQTDEKFDDYYNKEEIDTKLEELPTGGTELTGGDNTVIEDNKINVYTNTGYKVSDKDIQLQSITDSGTTGTNKMVYTDDEIIVLYDGTNKIRRSENGIDFEVIELPLNCISMIYNSQNKKFIGLTDNERLIYSDDLGKTWTEKEDMNLTNVSYLYTSNNFTSFNTINKTDKTILTYTEDYRVNNRLTSLITPEHITNLNTNQIIWCNNNGTFKYGAGSNEGNFVSLTNVEVNILKNVNEKVIVGLKNTDKLYILNQNTVAGSSWVEYKLPDVCTVNDIIFSPYDEVYYIFNDVKTYYKTKDFVEYDKEDKSDLRGLKGHFTLMGIQVTTLNHNELLLIPTRTKVENMLQLLKRETNKDRWVGPGFERVGKEQIGIKYQFPLNIFGNGSLGLRTRSIDASYLSEDLLAPILSTTKEILNISPWDLEIWFWENWNGQGDVVFPFIFTEEGSFYDLLSYEGEYVVERAEYGYLFVSSDAMSCPYVRRAKFGIFLS